MFEERQRKEKKALQIEPVDYVRAAQGFTTDPVDDDMYIDDPSATQADVMNEDADMEGLVNEDEVYDAGADAAGADAADGEAADGDAADGDAADRDAADGDTADGEAAIADATADADVATDATHGDAADGDTADGDAASADAADGEAAIADATADADVATDAAHGDAADGDTASADGISKHYHKTSKTIYDSYRGAKSMPLSSKVREDLGLLADMKASTADINRYLSDKLDMVLISQQTRTILQEVLGSTTVERTRVLLDTFVEEDNNDVLLVQDQMGHSYADIASEDMLRAVGRQFGNGLDARRRSFDLELAKFTKVSKKECPELLEYFSANWKTCVSNVGKSPCPSFEYLPAMTVHARWDMMAMVELEKNFRDGISSLQAVEASMKVAGAAYEHDGLTKRKRERTRSKHNLIRSRWSKRPTMIPQHKKQPMTQLKKNMIEVAVKPSVSINAVSYM
ncbi:hypothetical protein PInf_022354 [Phytophthora infestans]|nr:hypothetical protein PInf_022354 [Phytophthora infestans]